METHLHSLLSLVRDHNSSIWAASLSVVIIHYVLSPPSLSVFLTAGGQFFLFFFLAL